MNPSMPSSNGLFTLGHSNQEMSDFLGTLLRHEIKAVCDVRSRPGSFRFPQFNREPLEAQLTAAKIRYEFCGEQLGGRPLDPTSNAALPGGHCERGRRTGALVARPFHR